MKLTTAQRRFLFVVYLAERKGLRYPFSGLNRQTAEALERRGLLTMQWDDEDGGDKFGVDLTNEGRTQMVRCVQELEPAQ